MKEEITGEVVAELGRFPRGWTLDQLIALRGRVAEMLAGNRDRISRGWSTRLAGLARIMLSERAQAQRVDRYNRAQKMKAEAKNR